MGISCFDPEFNSVAACPSSLNTCLILFVYKQVDWISQNEIQFYTISLDYENVSEKSLEKNETTVTSLFQSTNFKVSFHLQDLVRGMLYQFVEDGQCPSSYKSVFEIFQNIVDVEYLSYALDQGNHASEYRKDLEQHLNPSTSAVFHKTFQEATTVTSIVFEGKRQMRHLKQEDLFQFCANMVVLPLHFNSLTTALSLRNPVCLHSIMQNENNVLCILSIMEIHGFGSIQAGPLQEQENQIRARMVSIGKQMNKAAGDVLPTSHQQIKHVLFSKLRLDQTYGRPATGLNASESTLLYYAKYHDFPKLVLQYRKAHKLVSCYFKQILKYGRSFGLGQHGGIRLHPQWDELRASSGRIVSRSPNVQNFPKGGELRGYVKAPKGKIFVSADYRQIELRFVAHFSSDEKLLEIVKNHEDDQIFSTLYSHWKDFLPASITQSKQPCKEIKKIFYSVIYGVGKKSLSTTLGITQDESTNLIQGIYRTHPKVKDYTDRLIKQCRQVEGYTETREGFRKYMPQRRKGSFERQMHYERSCVNYALQGSVSELMKKCLLDFVRLDLLGDSTRYVSGVVWGNAMISGFMSD